MRYLINLFLLVCLAMLPVSVSAQTSWPIHEWPFSTPEEQGISSEQLAAMLETIQAEHLNLNSVMVVRNGVVVLDAYIYPFALGQEHEMYSVTKSISSILIGIAIEQGYLDLESLDQPVLSFFPDYTFQNVDDWKEAMTLRNVLTMTSGLDWSDASANSTLLEMLQVDGDWVQFVLDRPMAAEPGTQFNYCTGCSHILTAIVQSKTGMTALEFAQQNLFDPLGIDSVVWSSDGVGVTSGGFGIRMTPHDMAKIGYLYLNEGQWDGKQIVSPEWVELSTRNQLPELFENGGGYGYQWWVPEEGIYLASGLFGQRIVVIPHLNMVVVFTSMLTNDDPVLTGLVRDFIIPSAISTEPLPPNVEGNQRLDLMLRSISSP